MPAGLSPPLVLSMQLESGARTGAGSAHCSHRVEEIRAVRQDPDADDEAIRPLRTPSTATDRVASRGESAALRGSKFAGRACDGPFLLGADDGDAHRRGVSGDVAVQRRERIALKIELEPKEGE